MDSPIIVSARSEFLPDQSEPARGRFVFSYTITIANQGTTPAQLISRHWIITDESGAVQEVKGLGVIGQQPIISPGEKYTYSSGAVLDTATGTMTGSYQMKTNDNQMFEASIPTFALIPPHKLH